ncbi:MAG TPA: YkgJ family cysteine cluster protein [Bryobacteraceae bacterium]|nr:YkgJ family cysteine cluster protein [Bryobacteraceae bacterium]
MITDLVQIRRLEQQKRGENSRFRAYLKHHRHSDRRLRRFGEDIEAEIDCTACANCCRVTEVGITERDIEKLAKFIGVSEREFLEQFTASDATGARILKRNEKGCVFLEGNLCTVYEARPNNCANFPHVVRGTGSIASRMWEFLDRAGYCPIIYNWMEKVKEDIGFL